MSREFKALTIHLGDVFIVKNDNQYTKRVVNRVGNPGEITVGTAIPALNSKGREYFIVFGSTHYVTEIKEIVDHWDIARLIAAHKAGLTERYGMLPALNRKRLAKEFQEDILTRRVERLITPEEFQTAYIRSSRYR